jgi:hypothetical protein
MSGSSLQRGTETEREREGEREFRENFLQLGGVGGTRSGECVPRGKAARTPRYRLGRVWEIGRRAAHKDKLETRGWGRSGQSHPQPQLESHKKPQKSYKGLVILQPVSEAPALFFVIGCLLSRSGDFRHLLVDVTCLQEQSANRLGLMDFGKCSSPAIFRIPELCLPLGAYKIMFCDLIVSEVGS